MRDTPRRTVRRLSLDLQIRHGVPHRPLTLSEAQADRSTEAESCGRHPVDEGSCCRSRPSKSSRPRVVAPCRLLWVPSYSLAAVAEFRTRPRRHFPARRRRPFLCGKAVRPGMRKWAKGLEDLRPRPRNSWRRTKSPRRTRASTKRSGTSPGSSVARWPAKPSNAGKRGLPREQSR